MAGGGHYFCTNSAVVKIVTSNISTRSYGKSATIHQRFSFYPRYLSRRMSEMRFPDAWLATDNSPSLQDLVTAFASKCFLVFVTLIHTTLSFVHHFPVF